LKCTAPLLEIVELPKVNADTTATALRLISTVRFVFMVILAILTLNERDHGPPLSYVPCAYEHVMV
jgi:hypothetical protein